MDQVSEVVRWFADPAHWQGYDGVPIRLLEHIRVSGVSFLVAALIGLPVGLIIGHLGRGGFLVVTLANLGRAIPSYAFLLLLFVFFRLSDTNAIVALTLLGLPPIVTNAYVGLREVDRDLVEAGRGMGMAGRQLLGQVEVPAAMPVILAGLRTAAVQIVATATLLALLGGGGLGRFIIDGFALQDDARILAGAILVGLLAIATERTFAFLQAILVSPGLRAEGPLEAPASGTLATPAA
jgi:osmoprotectant transport system permease protein